MHTCRAKSHANCIGQVVYLNMFTHSILIDDRHIVRAKKLVEGARKKLLYILPGLSLNQAQAALKIRVQVSADMGLSFSAWCLVARGFLRGCFPVRGSWRAGRCSGAAKRLRRLPCARSPSQAVAVWPKISTSSPRVFTNSQMNSKSRLSSSPAFPSGSTSCGVLPVVMASAYAAR